MIWNPEDYAKNADAQLQWARKLRENLNLLIYKVMNMNSEFVNAQNSSEKKQNPDLVRQLNFLIPPSGAVTYVVLPPGEKITGRLGLPAAQLIDPRLNWLRKSLLWYQQN